MLGGFAPLPLRLVADALSGLSASQHARLCTDLRSGVESLPFAIVAGAYTSSTNVITSYLGQNGVGLAAAPVLSDASSGFHDLTWPASHTDDYGVVTATNIKHAVVTVSGVAARNIVATIVNPLTVRLRASNSGGSTETTATWTLVVS